MCTKRQTGRINENVEDGWKNKLITKVGQTASYLAAEREKWHNYLTTVMSYLIILNSTLP